MRLTLVRHGEASPATDGNDIKRPLTSRGHAQAKKNAGFLKGQVIPDMFVDSVL